MSSMGGESVLLVTKPIRELLKLRSPPRKIPIVTTSPDSPAFWSVDARGRVIEAQSVAGGSTFDYFNSLELAGDLTISCFVSHFLSPVVDSGTDLIPFENLLQESESR